MKDKLSWITALNEETVWTSNTDALKWLGEVTGRPLAVDAGDPALAAFLADISFIRVQVSHLHFGEPVNLKALDQRLANIDLMLADPDPSKESLVSLPLFRARPMGNSDQYIIRSIGDTLIVQFAQFIGDAVQSGSNVAVARCEGLFRETKSKLERAQVLSSEMEGRWRNEISVLKEVGPETAEEIMRCEDLFLAHPKTRFCSDACRFNTFQITKQVKDPGYLAQKQKRYRSRKGKTNGN